MNKLKQKLEEETHIPKDDQKLIFSGVKDFSDDDLLSTLRINTKTKIMLIGTKLIL